MLAATLSLTMLGLFLGAFLGIAARVFRVESNPLVEEINNLMPGSNCGNCGYPGCRAAAEALVKGRAAVTLCPPGGKALIAQLATKLGMSVDLNAVEDQGPRLAVVAEELCIGCCRCLKACPTDAIVGAAKQIHSVLREACTGCEKCIERCPTEALSMQPMPVTLQHWVFPKPAVTLRSTAAAG